MFIDLSNLLKLINPVYIPLFKNKSRHLILRGGAGSGKSVFTVQKILLRIITEKNHKILVTRKFATTLYDSVYTEFLTQIAAWDLLPLVQPTKMPLQIRFPHFNSVIIFKGLDNPEKIKSISGVTSIWMEESSECSLEDFQNLNERLRGKTKYYKQIIQSFNPVSVLHWLKPTFFDHEYPDCTTIKTTYQDNNFLDPEYVKQLEYYRVANPDRWRVYGEGEWGVLGEKVFYNYRVLDFKKHGIKEELFDTIFCGLDFGFNHRSAYIRCAIQDNRIYIFKEYSMSKLTTKQLIERIKPVHRENLFITADSAEPDRIKEFYEAGFKIKPAIKGDRSLYDGIDFLKNYEIIIDVNCPYMYSELESFQYKKDKFGNVLEDVIQINDDCIAALRYATEDYRLNLVKNRFKIIGANGLLDNLERQLEFQEIKDNPFDRTMQFKNQPWT